MRIIQSSTTSPRIFWKYLNRNKPNVAPPIPTSTDQSTQFTIDNDFEKAHIFNETFVSVKPKPIPSHFEIPIKPPETTSLFIDSDFSVIEVFNILEKLNTSKSPDVDGFAN